MKSQSKLKNFEIGNKTIWYHIYRLSAKLTRSTTGGQKVVYEFSVCARGVEEASREVEIKGKAFSFNTNDKSHCEDHWCYVEHKR